MILRAAAMGPLSSHPYKAWTEHTGSFTDQARSGRGSVDEGLGYKPKLSDCVGIEPVPILLQGVYLRPYPDQVHLQGYTLTPSRVVGSLQNLQSYRVGV